MGTGAATSSYEADAVRLEAQRLARQEAARLGAQDIDAVALTWVDTSGVVRVKGVPTQRLSHAVGHGIGMSPVFDVFTSDDAITASEHLGGPDGDLRLIPDLDRLTVLAAQPGWAWAPADRFDQRGTPHPACGRDFVRRMTAAAAARGLRLRMGFETEWVACLPSAGADPVPATTGPAYGMTRLVERSDYLRDVLRALRAQEVDVLQIHPEYTAGQFEVSTAPGSPLTAADDVVLVRETVRAVSERHGLRASFAPSVIAGQVGNGCHLHIGLGDREADPEADPDPATGAAEGGDLLRGGPGPHGLTGTAQSFLAGVLDLLPALLAVGAPSPASYLRLAPSRWAGVFQCWGLENREAAVRLITGPADEPGGAHAEVKCFDAAANPYLLAGSVIAAGLAGIDAGLALPQPVQGDPALVAPATPRLPDTLARATDRFEGCEPLREAMGPMLHEAVVAVRRAEDERLAEASDQDIAAATRWRY